MNMGGAGTMAALAGQKGMNPSTEPRRKGGAEMDGAKAPRGSVKAREFRQV